MVLTWGRGRLLFFHISIDADHGPHWGPDFVELIVLSAMTRTLELAWGFKPGSDCFLTVQSWESNLSESHFPLFVKLLLFSH